MFGLNETQWRDLVLSVNVHRKSRRLSPFETATHLGIALRQTDVRTLAQALGFSDITTLLKIASLKDLPTDVAPLIEWGRAPGTVSMSTAAQLARLPSRDLASAAIKAAVQYSFDKEEARQLVQIFQRSGQPLNRCVEQVLETRPRIERSELIIGSLL